MTIPSVALADLIHVKVPVFEGEIMENLSNIESISMEEVIDTTRKLLENVSPYSELEKVVKKSLICAGWNEKNFVQESNNWIEVGNQMRWRPDLVYRLPDGRMVIIEIKARLLMIRADWIQIIRRILQVGSDYIFILTTGVYYEVHISGIEKSLQLMKTPTISEILDWEKEVR